MKKFLAILVALMLLLVQIPAIMVSATETDVRTAFETLNKLPQDKKAILLGKIWDYTVQELNTPGDVTPAQIFQLIKDDPFFDQNPTVWSDIIDDNTVADDGKISEAAAIDVIDFMLIYRPVVVEVHNNFKSITSKTIVKTKLGLTSNATEGTVLQTLLRKSGPVVDFSNGEFIIHGDPGDTIVGNLGLKNDPLFGNGLLAGLVNDEVDRFVYSLNTLYNDEDFNEQTGFDQVVTKTWIIEILKAYGLFYVPYSPPSSSTTYGSNVVVASGNNTVGKGTISGTPSVDPKGNALLSLALSDLENAKKDAPVDDKGVKSVKIKVEDAKDAKLYNVQLPTSELASGKNDTKFEIETPVGNMVVPSNMLDSADFKGIADVQLSMALADTTNLSADLKQQIGNKPVIDITLSAGGKTIEWSNPSTPVTISFKYTPTEAEKKNLDHIAVWYIDGAGKVVSVPNGKYDSATGTVVFTTTHFSKYAAAYVQKTFSDAGKYAWAKDSIEVLASKGILGGASADKFNPDADITRAEFLAGLVKALGLTAKFDSNFDDIKTTDSYYNEIGIAKKLGITTGSGNNKFGPNTTISRQDMMVFVSKALKIAGKIKTEGKDSDLSKFTDKSKVAGYAKDSVATLVKNGIITGNSTRLNPTGKLSRASAAVTIYRLYKM